MRLYLLRHEARSVDDPTFYSALTPHGKQAARNLIGSLSEIEPIRYIYTSPFLRCIQTIAPFAHKRGHCLRRDFALYERVHTTDPATAVQFNPANFRIDFPTDHPLHALLDPRYASSIGIDALEWEETAQDVCRRGDAFVDHIRPLLELDDDAAILVVSHLSVINAIRGLPDDTPLPMGELIQVR